MPNFRKVLSTPQTIQSVRAIQSGRSARLAGKVSSREDAMCRQPPGLLRPTLGCTLALAFGLGLLFASDEPGGDLPSPRAWKARASDGPRVVGRAPGAQELYGNSEL